MSNIPNEDSLRDYYDRVATHSNPHSPYYDGPDEEEEDDEPPEDGPVN